jgi:repressor LexA
LPNPRILNNRSVCHARQEEILDFIRGYQREHATPPSVRVVQRQFKFSSTNAVVSHLRALATKNALHQLPDGSWGVRASEVQGLFDLPIYGAIPAGKPDEREQHNPETITVDPSAFGIRPSRQRPLWALRVTGDSMIDAHICEGDIGVFERRDPRPGDIIAALVDGVATTLKRLVLVRGKPVLRAENKRYPDIIPAERLECQGVLVGLIRRVATTG